MRLLNMELDVLWFMHETYVSSATPVAKSSIIRV